MTGGLTGGPYQAQLGATLAPGQSEPVWFVLTDQVGNGPWNATVTLRSGLIQESFRGQITFAPGTDQQLPPSPSAAVSASARPWPSRPWSCC